MTEPVSFWARRRAAVKSEEVREARAAEIAESERTAAEFEAMDDADALEALGLPDPATLGPGDDFSAFMRSTVPDRFRRVALRRLWRSNPVLACVDGLNDYDDDYRSQALGQVVKTAYQVGKGMLAHTDYLEAAQSDRQEAASLASEPDGEPVPSDPATDVAPGRALTSRDSIADAAQTETKEQLLEPAGPTQTEDASEDDPAPRRMRFKFEEASA